ncbi:hypothetical protein B4168_1756 [Anoxybacillus flavithermus]|nr:hypothetical protein B4168_1756 [Anoxybacillus flavithermus]OAO84765.1 hypothetical protein GT23_3370 [Parageobacillus thermoglucosidasius]
MTKPKMIDCDTNMTLKYLPSATLEHFGLQIYRKHYHNIAISKGKSAD